MIHISVGGAIFYLLFILYWWSLGRLVGSILKSPRLKAVHWLIIGTVNAFALFFVWSFYPDAQVLCVSMLVLMLTEFLLFYRDRFAGAILCVLACCIHIMAGFVIVLGARALYMGRSSQDILSNYTDFLWCCIALFFFLDVLTVGAQLLVPLSMLKLINQHKEQRWFMIAWMAVSILCLLYMEGLLHQPAYTTSLAGTQIAVSVALLVCLYIVLFFAIRTSMLLGYKEKHAELERAIQKEQQYRSLMVRDAIASYVINVTQDLLLKGFEEQREQLGDTASCYTEMLVQMSPKLIHPEDINAFVRDYGRMNILRLCQRRFDFARKRRTNYAGIWR